MVPQDDQPRQLGPDDTRKGPPPRVAPALAALMRDPCECGSHRLVLTREVQKGLGKISEVFRFDSETERAIEEGADPPPTARLATAHAVRTVTVAGTVEVDLRCCDCGAVQHRIGCQPG